ncbi:basic proline-rich protein-like [Vulpes lagopus]|uniref:basic proline-rich protein-like n=1 Tax=Vulpes lagopus TaxID=494514 RepID=UPI001BCA27FC|nr:basic proline-rich protein-like [Vulpes lagopus]
MSRIRCPAAACLPEGQSPGRVSAGLEAQGAGRGARGCRGAKREGGPRAGGVWDGRPGPGQGSPGAAPPSGRRTPRASRGRPRRSFPGRPAPTCAEQGRCVQGKKRKDAPQGPPEPLPAGTRRLEAAPSPQQGPLTGRGGAEPRPPEAGVRPRTAPRGPGLGGVSAGRPEPAERETEAPKESAPAAAGAWGLGADRVRGREGTGWGRGCEGPAGGEGGWGRGRRWTCRQVTRSRPRGRSCTGTKGQERPRLAPPAPASRGCRCARLQEEAWAGPASALGPRGAGPRPALPGSIASRARGAPSPAVKCACVAEVLKAVSSLAVGACFSALVPAARSPAPLAVVPGRKACPPRSWGGGGGNLGLGSEFPAELLAAPGALAVGSADRGSSNSAVPSLTSLSKPVPHPPRGAKLRLRTACPDWAHSPLPASAALHPELCTPGSTPRALHPGLYTPSAAPPALHPELCIPGSAPPALHPRLCTPSSAPRALHPQLYTPSAAPPALHPGLCTLSSAPQALHPERCTPGSAPRALHPELCTPGSAPRRSTPRARHPQLCIPGSAFPALYTRPAPWLEAELPGPVHLRSAHSSAPLLRFMSSCGLLGTLARVSEAPCSLF